MFKNKIDDDVAVACTFLLMEQEKKKKTIKKRRRMWMRQLFLNENKFYYTLRVQIQNNDPDLFKNFLRMSIEDFDFILNKISPLMVKQDTHLREAICPGERLAITLRYLATGDNYSSLMSLFKRFKFSICHIISEVCDAILKIFKDEYLGIPTSEAEWQSVADGFHQKWNYPNCFGAADGKHVEIVAPSKCGSEYFNYKKQNSIVLMALVDADYNILYIDVGAKGRESDGGVFSRCSLYNALENGTLNLPARKCLPGRSKPIPYVMVADDAFPLKPYIMKPFNFRSQSPAERIFSYRLSFVRAQKKIE